MNLRLDGCSHAAAKYAVQRWHYSGILPTGKLVKIGAWEEGRFLGAVLFSRGACPWLGKRWGLDAPEICELTRVALRAERKTCTSKIVALALRLLHRHSPEVRMVVSFADPALGHAGTIYQAGNWIYLGVSSPTQENFIDGRWRHVRGSHWRAKGRDDVRRRTRPGKHRYLWAFDKSDRAQLTNDALPYPKKADEATGVAAGDQPEKGGSIPTRSLQLKEGGRA